MLEDIRTMAWKEFHEILSRRGDWATTGWVSSLVMMALLGVYFGATSPDLLATWTSFGLLATVGAVSVTMLVGDAFAGERERRTLEMLLTTRLPETAILLGKLGAMVTYAAVMIGAALASAFAVSVAANGGRIVASTTMVGGAVLLALLTSSLLALIGMFASMRAPTVRHAAQLYMGVVMGAFLAFFLVSVVGVTTFGFVAGAVGLDPEQVLAVLTHVLRPLVEGGAAPRIAVAALALAALNGLAFAFVRRWFSRERVMLV